ncbi:pentapeptide repeat-containing protein [uncultured Clostridium sp.]|uniref:pentapeptide repeat-containing protein n=1 Tax=uncultured Clostridium sp. TaxID=59620 RepID=UPI0028E8A86C|nr:pentapeptide repeat-containing protein [uncultured Clostridium sp.]
MDCFENEKIKDLKLRNEVISDKEYIDCEFYNCNFIDVDFNNCLFKDCKFHNCTMNGIRFKFSVMKNAILDGSDFISINWNTLKGDSIGAEPINTVRECFFKYNNFILMKLNKVKFSSSKFQESLFENCDLIEADFKDTRFESTQFIQCNMEKADFRGAHGYVIDIQSNKLKKAKFSFPEVINLLNSIDIVID